MSEAIIGDFFKPLFNDKFSALQSEFSMIEQSTEKVQTIGEFLLFILILEKYIDECVLSKHPDLSIMNYEKQNFSIKINILKKMDALAEVTINAIRSLNNIRNNFAHNLNFKKTNKEDRDNLNKFLSRWRKNENEQFKTLDIEQDTSKYCRIVTWFLLIEIISAISLFKAHNEINEKYLKDKEEIFSLFSSNLENDNL